MDLLLVFAIVMVGISVQWMVSISTNFAVLRLHSHSQRLSLVVG